MIPKHTQHVLMGLNCENKHEQPIFTNVFNNKYANDKNAWTSEKNRSFISWKYQRY